MNLWIQVLLTMAFIITSIITIYYLQKRKRYDFKILDCYLEHIFV